MSQFEQLLSALNEPIFEMDAAGVVTFAAPALRQWTSRDSGFLMADVVNPVDRPRFLNALQRILDGQTANAQLEMRLTDADGIEHPIEMKLAANRQEGGKTLSVVAWLRDLTSEKARDAAANIHLSHLADLIEHISDACIIETADGTIEQVNIAFCEMFGIKSATQSLIGTSCEAAFLQAVGEKKGGLSYPPFTTAVASEIELSLGEKRRVKHQLRPVLVDATVVARLHVFRVVDNKSKTISPTPPASTLSVTDAAQLQTIEKIAHDLADTVEGAGSAIYRAEQLELPGQVLESFRRVERSAQSAFAAIAGLVDFSKLESSEIELDIGEFYLRENIASMLSQIVPRAEQCGVQLKLRVEQDVPKHLTGDGARLMLCLRNLLECALPMLAEAVAGTEVSLLVEPEYSADNHIHLSFTVTQTLPKGTTRPKSTNPATMMQLSLARQIVRAMHFNATGKAGGKIDVKERKEHTSWHFAAAFPYRAARSTHRRPTYVTLTGMHIMIVSNDIAQRKFLSELARGWRMIPHEADNAAMALRLLTRVAEEQEAIPLVITANQLPVQDGFTLAFRIRHNYKLRETAVVMLTATGRPGDAMACRENGIIAYLRQPLSPNQLFEAFSAVVGAHQDDESSATLITRHSLREAKAGTILVIDSNREQAMAAAIALKKADYRISTADSDTVAQIEIDQDTYDLVIIDPTTTGFADLGIESLPEALRKKLPPASHNIPILLALADDISAVEYGFAGTVKKPYDKEELIKTVARHLVQKPTV